MARAEQTQGLRPESFPLLESKLCPTPPRTGTVTRAALVNRLRAARGATVAVVSAPAGYGKTTLLAEWGRRDERPFAWLSLDEAENDPTVFLTYLAAALDRVEALDPAVFKALSGARSSPQSIVARLGRSLASLRSPIVLALDDVHVLRAPACIDALATLVDQLPAGSQLVLASRTAPKLPLGKLRAEGRVIEVGPDDLSLTAREAQALLTGAGLKLAEHEVAALTRSTEGWPAGLYLAALSLRASSQGGRSAAGFRGDDRYISDYFRLVLLESLPEAEIEFLTRASVLDRMCGQLCDHVLERSDSSIDLERLERSNLFVVPLDHERRWYRFHHLFRDMLEDEFERREPGLAGRLSGRAADWHVAHGDVEGAIDYAHAGGDGGRVIELVGIAAHPAYQSGRFATVERWLARLEEEHELTQNTALAVLGAWTHALRGRPEAARRWAQVADDGPEDAVMPDGGPALAWTSALRAAMCPNGIEAMREDAEAAVRSAFPGSQATATAALLLGIAHVLDGDEVGGAAMLAEVGELAVEVGATDNATLALATRSLLANARDDAAEAEALALQARDLVDSAHVEDYASSALTYVASARAALRHNNWTRAATDIERATQLTPLLTYALPWLAVQVRLELTRAHLSLVSWSAAAAVMAEVDELLARRPKLGVLNAQAAELQRRLATGNQHDDNWASSLTGAELRLLPLLTTHLSFREIAERLFVSRNTVKTQAISVYRKLGVSSRSEAIERATELGLFAPATDVVPRPVGQHE
jgi:LuxR family transcriptional regulator, maltose regulon positive regulatory protein